ncbi:cpr-6, partial [Symbiodinium sp. CCMP2456]
DCEDGSCDANTLLQFRRADVGPWSFGAIIPGDADYKSLVGSPMPKLPLHGAIPQDFEVASAWPYCASVVNHIRDQSKCGSCWAVGSVSTMNDRLCVQKADNSTILSADDPLANCNSTIEGSELPTCVRPVLGGCFGGQLEFAWKWYAEVGAVNGTGYIQSHRHVGATCAPYPFPPCHSPDWKNRPECQKSFATPGNFSTCPDEFFPTPYWKNKVKAARWYSVPARHIQGEILARGSVSCQVAATCSMANYTAGVYVPSGKVCGGHVMRITGWGVEGGKDYWWVANSWGPQWGLNGFIKWIRGIDAQGIESGVVAGIL